MRVRVLGCNGGIGDNRHTTSFLIDEDILLDAGSGVTRLDLDALVKIDHVFLTHAHLDHVLALPPLLDSVLERRAGPVTLYAVPEVLEVLRQHLFNWHIWPDFSCIPSKAAPLLVYQAIAVGQPVQLGQRQITPIPANHVVPAVGYHLRSARGSVIFSGDTCSHAALWDIAAATHDLKHLIVECSFPNDMREIADLSRHYCPATLSADLAQLRPDIPVWLTHMKPGREMDIIVEVDALLKGRVVQPLREGHLFDI